MRSVLVLTLVLLGLTVVCLPAEAQVLFRATLTADAETHDVISTAGGTAVLVLKNDQAEFAISVDGLSGPISGAHIHHAATGVSGGVVRAITDSFVGGTASGVWRNTDSQPLTPELIGALIRGDLYVNIHTAANPAGEIRGQLLLDMGTLLSGALTTAQESHDVVSTGTGTVAAWLLGEVLVFSLTVDDLTGPVTAAHLHHAPAGVDGMPVRTISGAFDGNTAFGIWTPDQAEPLTQSLVAALLLGEIYLNVHTATYPAGELRAQLSPASGWAFGGFLDAAQVTDPVVSDARGTFGATLTTAGLAFSMTVEGLSGDITAAHFHHAVSGAAGPPVKTISTFHNNTAHGLWGYDDDEPLTVDLVRELIAGNIYVNVHTGAYPSGEIRSQLGLATGSGLIARMSPAQEVHDVVSDASGTAIIHLTPLGAEYSVSVTGLTGPVTNAHFHNAPAGLNGGVVRTITDAFSDGTASGLWSALDSEGLTTDLIENLLTGDLYVNVHTAAHPAGELRGQFRLVSGTGLQAVLTPSQETHDVTSGASGTAAMVHTPFGVTYAMTVTGLSGTVTGAHFHDGEVGTSGGVVRTLTDDFSGGSATGLWTASDGESLTDDLAVSLLSAGLYVNVHTTINPAGEIRGQVSPRGQLGLVAQLDADQETHDVVSGARGTAAVALSPTSVRYDLTVEGLSGPITAAHFHRGEKGTDGGVIRTITGDFSGGTAGGVWLPGDAQPLTTEMAVAVGTQGTYLNVHTANNPMGEIRGQVVDAQVEINVAIERLADDTAPLRFALDEAYPNPFNPTTTMTFTLDQSGPARLEVFDLLGRKIATLVDGTLPIGLFRVTFDAGQLPSGTYLYALTAGSNRAVRKMTLVK